MREDADGTMAVSTNFGGENGRTLDERAPLELFRSAAAFSFEALRCQPVPAPGWAQAVGKNDLSD